MAIPVTTQCVCDPKPLAQRWALRAHRSPLFRHIRCYFNTLEEMTARRAPCVFHSRNKSCRLPTTRPDLVVIGMPCQPFSLQRGDRKKVCPQRHPSFQVMVDFLCYTKATGVGGGIVEEVLGFGNAIAESRWFATDYCRVMPKSWCDWFCADLQHQGYYVRCLKLDNAWFSDIPRPRHIRKPYGCCKNQNSRSIRMLPCSFRLLYSSSIKIMLCRLYIFFMKAEYGWKKAVAWMAEQIKEFL